MPSICPDCAHENAANAAFCDECGHQFEHPCPHCGHPNRALAKFCGACGHQLSPEANHSRPQPSPPDPQANGNDAPALGYTPPHLTRDLLVTRTAIEGERKQVTVLFCDIVSSTALAERIGAERMHDLLDRFFEVALQEVHRYEGTINQFLGDGFMALFGAPVAHEDHQLRAARAALALQQAIRALSNRAQDEDAHLQLRMGLNTGPVVVGKIGDNLRMDYTAVGDTTNLAARLQQAAPPGEAYLSDATHGAIRRHFDCELVGERRVKGKAQAVRMYRLLGLHSAGHVGGAVDQLAVHSPLVGREREYAVLQNCIVRLRQGMGGIVGIVGDAGVGKSRLVAEVRQKEHAYIQWLDARAVSFGQAISYGPFMEILRNLCGIAHTDTSSHVWEKLRVWLAEVFGEQGTHHLPYIGAVLGCERRGESATAGRGLNAEDFRGQIYISMRRLIERLTARSPVVLELDDWHWADDASAALLEHLLPLVGTAPLLIVFAGRRDAGTPCFRAWSQASQRHAQHYIELLLGSLSNSESNKLIENLILLPEVPPQLRGRILERADGNPFFIEEVVRSLLSTGALRRNALSGRMEITIGADQVVLPDRIEGVIMARIDRLEEEVKQVLKLAAVIGRIFHQRILQALDRAEHHLDECLERLQEMELIRQKQSVPELEFMFKHALVREVSYASILVDRRRKLHGQVAEAIEHLFSDRLEEFSAFLADHYARAENWDKAQHYLFLAGDQALRMAADVEAMTHYEQAVTAYERVYGAKWDPLKRASLARKMGEALFRLGKDDQAAEQFSVALASLGAKFPRTEHAVRLQLVGEALRQVWHRFRLAVRPLPAAAGAPSDEERHRIYVRLGLIDYYRDPRRFLFDVLAAVNWAERRGLGAFVAKGYTGLGVICDALALHSIAERYHQRALLAAQNFSDLSAEALGLYGVAFHEVYVGHWDAADQAFLRSAALWRQDGAIRELGICIGTSIWLANWRGDVQTSLTRRAELARLADESGDTHLQVWATYLAAVHLIMEGKLDAGMPMLPELIEWLKRAPDYPVLVDALGQLADGQLRRGDVTGALATIAQAKVWMAKKNTRGHLLIGTITTAIRAHIAHAEQQGGSHKRALRAASHACRSARRLGRCFSGALVQIECGLGTIAWLKRRADAAQAHWNRSLALAQSLGARYDLAVTQREIGRFTKNPDALQIALDLFRESGATWDAARTMRFLGESLLDDDPKQAAAWLAAALELHAGMTAHYELALTHAAHSKLSTALGDFDEAQSHASKADEAHRRSTPETTRKFRPRSVERR